MKKKLTILVALCISLSQFQCSESINPSIDSSGTPNFLFYPLAVGNMWIYCDSAQTVFDTVIIQSRTNVGDTLWWKLQNPSFACAELQEEFGSVGDTLIRWAYDRGGSRFVTSLFLPPRDTSYHFERFYGDVGEFIRVTKYYRSCTVPAGRFDQYITYVADRGSQKDSVVIVPRVGIVARIFSWFEYPDKKQFTRKSFLYKYKLK